MPDISMCRTECRKSTRCKRHQNSGTIPSPFWQSFMTYQPDTKENPCESFWDTGKKPNKHPEKNHARPEQANEAP